MNVNADRNKNVQVFCMRCWSWIVSSSGRCSSKSNDSRRFFPFVYSVPLSFIWFGSTSTLTCHLHSAEKKENFIILLIARNDGWFALAPIRSIDDVCQKCCKLMIEEVEDREKWKEEVNDGVRKRKKYLRAEHFRKFLIHRHRIFVQVKCNWLRFRSAFFIKRFSFYEKKKTLICR